jgi:hypothetical protein
VCLRDVEQAIDGVIRSARLVAHDRSMSELLAQLEEVRAGGVIVNTAADVSESR